MSGFALDLRCKIVYQLDVGKKAGPRLITLAYGSLTRPPADLRLYESRHAMQPEIRIATSCGRSTTIPTVPNIRRSETLDSS